MLTSFLKDCFSIFTLQCNINQMRTHFLKL